MALPNPKTAYEHVFSNVYSRAFFGRLSQHGVNIANQKQAEDCLNMAEQLRVMSNHPSVKAANTDPISDAGNALGQLMTRHGLTDQRAELGRKTAAEQLAANPDIFNSILSLKSAEAVQVAEKLGLTVAA